MSVNIGQSRLRVKWKIFLAVVLAGSVCLCVGGEEWRGVLIKKGGQIELVTDFGQAYPAKGSFKDEYLNGQSIVQGRALVQKKNKENIVQSIIISGVKPYVAEDNGNAKPMATKVQPYAKTSKVLPSDQLKPAARIELSLPELGNSAASGGSKPVSMMVSLPTGYRRGYAHPVIIHFGGGMGGAGQAEKWRKIEGTENFIIVGADYNFEENQKKGLIKIGTCRDFDSEIALTAIQILCNSTMIDTNTLILTGMSSGAYSITDNLKVPKAWKPFGGYCVIAGGSDTASAQIASRPILFVMGQNDTLRHGWMNSAVSALKKANPDKLTVEMVPNTGHEWNKAMDEVIAKWLKREFVHAGAVDRLNALLKDNEYAGASACILQWLEEYKPAAK
ncbi:MAG: hypothetical protein WAX69_24570 [Victivallales bacterium]